MKNNYNNNDITAMYKESSNRAEYDTLHALRLLHAYGGLTQTETGSELEQKLLHEERQGRVKVSNGFLGLGETRYKLTIEGKDYLKREKGRVQARRSFGTDTDGDYIIRNSILNGGFDNTQFHFYERHDSPASDDDKYTPGGGKSGGAGATERWNDIPTIIPMDTSPTHIAESFTTHSEIGGHSDSGPSCSSSHSCGGSSGCSSGCGGGE